MSISNLLAENNYDLFCNSITLKDGPIIPDQFTPGAAIWYMNTAVQNVSDQVVTKVLWDTTVNPSSFAALPVTYAAGTWTCTNNCIMNASYQIKFVAGAAPTTPYRALWINQSNVTGRTGETVAISPIPGSGGLDFISGACSTALKIGDTFEVDVFQTAAAPSVRTIGNFTNDAVTFSKITMNFMYEE
jgi:hypothetical protein